MTRAGRLSIIMVRVLAVLILAFLTDGTSLPAVAGEESRLRVETRPLPYGAELITIFAEYSPAGAAGPQGELPLVSVVRDTLSSRNPEESRLGKVWVFTYSRPTVAQRIAGSFPFLFRRTLRNTGSADSPPKPLVDLSAPERASLANLLGLTMQAEIFDLNGILLRASTRTYQGNSREYERIHAEQALEVLSRLDSESQVAVESESPGLRPAEIAHLVARISLNKQVLGGFVRASRLTEAYEKRTVETQIDRAHNWELLRQRAEQNDLYFDPLSFGQPVPGQALLWIAKEDLADADERRFDPNLLSIADPWRDESIRNWKGYTETWYFDASGGRVADASAASRAAEMIPLALYSLDYRKAPLLLVDFRSESKPKRRELLRRAADSAATGVLGLTGPFSNLEYFVAKRAWEFIRGRHGDPVDRNARLDAYAGLRHALLLDRELNPALKQELTRRLDQLALNPFEQDFRAEAELATRQYAALLKYAEAPDGLAKSLSRDRGREMVAYDHGPKSRALLRVATIATLGMYRHREPMNADSVARLERERGIQARVQFLERVLASTPQIDVVWDAAEIRRNLDELGDLEAGAEAPAISRLVARVFAGTSDEETRRGCLKCLYRLNSMAARQELTRLSTDESISPELRVACNSYLHGLPPPVPPSDNGVVSGGSGQ